MDNLQDYTIHSNPIPFVNTTSERIPPGAILANNGNPDDRGRKRMGKPTANSQRGCYLNGPFSIEAAGDANSFGWCSWNSPFIAAYDAAGPTPVIGEMWGPQAGSWFLGKDRVGFLIDGEAVDGLVAVVRDFALEDDYPYPGYGSYDDGDGGATWQHDSTLNIGCDEATGNIIGDEVRYTTVLFVRRGRPTASISMEVLVEDKILVATECKEVVVDVAVTVDVECVDGVITATPTVTTTTDFVRSVACGVCS